MTSIPFTQVAPNTRTPLFYAELDNSKANSGVAPQRSLVVGQQLATGSLTPNVPVLVQGLPWVKSVAGLGSMLAKMVEWYRKRDPYGELWILPLADNAAGVAATATLAIAGTATANGIINLYVGGDLVQQAVTSGQTAAQVATNLVATIGNSPDLAVTATAATGTVTFTNKHKGLAGNDLDFRANYRGAAAGETTPAGLTLTFTQPTNGAGNPTGATLDTAFSNVGERSFDFVAFPYNDSASLDSLKTWLATQWDAMHMLFGGAFGGYDGSLGAAQTLGAARNDPHTSIMPSYDSPTPPWLWAANYCGAAARELRADPALPLQTVALDVLAPPVASRFKQPERNTLLWNGMSSFTVDDDGTVRIETAITNYQKNPAGQIDDSYLYVERLYTLAQVIRILKGNVTSTFGRTKLADDGATFRAGAKIVTASTIRNALIGWYRGMERDGLVQESDLFAEALVVQRAANNSCRVDGLLPVVPIDQLRQLATLVQFRNATDVL